MKLKKKKFLSNEGWTFVETLIVMAIVMVLTTSVGLSAVSQIDKAKIISARSQIESFCIALDSYSMDVLCYPTEEQGLCELWSSCEDGWKGPYISRKLPKDPWGNDYVYIVPGPDNLPYGIISYGKDGKEGGEGYNSDVTSY